MQTDCKRCLIVGVMTMRKFILPILLISILLTGCMQTTPPANTEPTNSDAVKIEPGEVNINADFWGEQKTVIDGVARYTYSIYVHSDDIYATPRDNSVYFLDGAKYVPITEYKDGITVHSCVLNDGFGEGTSTFLKVTSPELLDKNKIFVEVIGTSEYQPGMVITTPEAYIEQYGEETLRDYIVAISQRGLKDSEKMFSMPKPIYDSLRLVNRGDGYNLIYISTKDTRAELIDDVLWTKLDIEYLTDCDYGEKFDDIINNTYVARADARGSYEDIEIILEGYETLVKYEDGRVYVGIKGDFSGPNPPNCVIGNTVLKDGETTISEEMGKKAIIVFFN